MSLITACPQCQTRFVVHDSQLSAHRGKVRCGHCQHVFNAQNFLLTPPIEAPILPTQVDIVPDITPIVEASTPEQSFAEVSDTPPMETAEELQEIEIAKESQEIEIVEEPQEIAATEELQKVEIIEELQEIEVVEEPQADEAETPHFPFVFVAAQEEAAIEIHSEVPDDAQQPVTFTSDVVSATSETEPASELHAEAEVAHITELLPDLTKHSPQNDAPVDAHAELPFEGEALLDGRVDEQLSAVHNEAENTHLTQHEAALNEDSAPYFSSDVIIVEEDLVEPQPIKLEFGDFVPTSDEKNSLIDEAVVENQAAAIQERVAPVSEVAKKDPPLFSDENNTNLAAASTISSEFLVQRKPVYTRWPYVLLFLLLLLGLATQLTYYLRTEIARELPILKPYLSKACAMVSCNIALSQNLSLLELEDSDMQENVLHHNIIQFSGVIKNRADYVQAYPQIEISLMDAQDKSLVRRVLLPKDYLSSDMDIASGLNANAELKINLNFDAHDITANNYHARLIY